LRARAIVQRVLEKQGGALGAQHPIADFRHFEPG
jgi:hypothetical protein